MKKKILFVILVCIISCCFAICISAATVYLDGSGKEMFRYETDSNGVITTSSGEFPKVDASNKELTWYITGTKTENGNTVHTVASAYSLDESFATVENGAYTYVGTTKDKVVSANFPDNAGILTLNIGEGFGSYSKTFPYASAKILFCYFPNTLTELPLRMLQSTPIIKAEFDDDAVVTTIPCIFAHKAQNLKNINIPDSVNKIDAKSWWEGAAFYSCISLESITIPESVTSIGNEAFSECTALTEINFNATSMADLATGNNVFYNAGKNGNGITVTIGKNVTKIPERLFCPDSYDATYSPKLINVIFEENSVCTSIGRSAFNRCESLTSINLPSTVTSIGMYAFLNCSSLKSITIPKSTTSIANEAFNGCTALTEIKFNATSLADFETNNCVFYNAGKNGNGITVTIGKNVTKIPERLLCPDSNTTAYSPKVTKVIFESGSQCTSIGQSAFNQCAHLQKINIPDSITSIGHWAFQNCTSLTSVTIPANLKTIGYHVFTGCTAITAIKYNAVALSDIPDEYYVFKNAGENGSGITVTIGKNVTRIPSYIFCPVSTSKISPKITSVIFEANSQCASIGASAFMHCDYLTMIRLPKSIARIEKCAFDDCDSLTEIIFEKESSLVSLGEDSFCNCTALKNVVLPRTLTTMYRGVFYNTALEKIVIPNTVTTMGKYVFECCDSLTIYAEATSKPSKWDSEWNSHNRPVVWDYKNTIKNDVFTFKGYSFNESGSMAYGYDIDYEAKVLYEELTGDILEMGVVFAAYDNLGGNQPLDENGQEVTISIGKVVKANINSYEYTYYDFILTDIDDSIKDVKFVISAYLYDGEAVKYVQENSLSNTVTGKSYNEAKESVAQ